MGGSFYLSSCYTCGLDLEESFFDTMRRASSSRREHPLGETPVVRSRSQERLVDSEDEDDNQEDEFHDAQQGTAESTDNDSVGVDEEHEDGHGHGNAIPKHSHRSIRGMHLERAMSDPFDTQEMQDAVQQVQAMEAAVTHAKPAAGAYPTLLRFPVAESRNKNCWSEPPVTIFSVRGPNYFDNKKTKLLLFSATTNWLDHTLLVSVGTRLRVFSRV